MMVNLFWNKTLFRYGYHLLIDTDIGTTVLITMEETPWLSSLCVECFTAMVEWKGKYLLYILWLWFGDELNHCSTKIKMGIFCWKCIKNTALHFANANSSMFLFFAFSTKKYPFWFFITPTIFANIGRIYYFLNRVHLIINNFPIKC